MSDQISKLKDLAELLEKGLITPEEFEEQKQILLSGHSSNQAVELKDEPSASSDFGLPEIPMDSSKDSGRRYPKSSLLTSPVVLVGLVLAVGGAASLWVSQANSDSDTNSSLNGLWVGSYGPHGPEVVEVQVQGDEITATKITGDPFVPAGNKTWWGNLSTGEVTWHGAKAPGATLQTVSGRIVSTSDEKIVVYGNMIEVFGMNLDLPFLRQEIEFSRYEGELPE